jgi:hypothetical protein
MNHPTLSIHAPNCVFVDGKWESPRGTGRLSVISPLTEEEIMNFPDGNAGRHGSRRGERARRI